MLEKQRKRQEDTTEKIEEKLQEVNDQAEHLQIEIGNLKIKIQELEDQNTALNKESQTMKAKYGPVTMIVPASGHQVRCIPWAQMGTFNKEIGFLCGLKFFSLNIFCGGYLQSSLHLMLQICWKPQLQKMYQ